MPTATRAHHHHPNESRRRGHARAESDHTSQSQGASCRREQRQRGAADHRKGREADTGDAVLRHQQARFPSIVRQAATCAALSSSRLCASSIILATRLSVTR